MAIDLRLNIGDYSNHYKASVNDFYTLYNEQNNRKDVQHNWTNDTPTVLEGNDGDDDDDYGYKDHQQFNMYDYDNYHEIGDDDERW